MILITLLLLVASSSSGAEDGPPPVYSNTCWDNDPSTWCPASAEARRRYLMLATPGGRQPDGVALDSSCRESERAVKFGGSNVSRCLEALRERAKLDVREPRVECDKTAALFHTWWDGPLVRVVALFLRSFRATQNPSCSKLIVWTPRKGSERSTSESDRLVREVQESAGAPVEFQELRLEAMARGTIFESFVRTAVLPTSWETSKPGDKKEGTRHFSDFFQLFVLHLYGGVYFDADTVLLRDFFPLWGLNFEYQWSFIPEKFNNAVQGLGKGEGASLSKHANKLQATACCRGWGETLWHAKIVKRLSGSYGLPCTAFDPYWLKMDGHHTGELKRPTVDYPARGGRNWLFQAKYTHDWYDGAFAIHWHGGAGGPHGGDTSVWEPTFVNGSFAQHFEHLFR